MMKLALFKALMALTRDHENLLPGGWKDYNHTDPFQPASLRGRQVLAAALGQLEAVVRQSPKRRSQMLPGLESATTDELLEAANTLGRQELELVCDGKTISLYRLSGLVSENMNGFFRPGMCNLELLYICVCGEFHISLDRADEEFLSLLVELCELEAQKKMVDSPNNWDELGENIKEMISRKSALKC